MDASTEVALKEIAVLVGISQGMREIAKTFRKSEYLDFETASPKAKTIIKFSKTTAQQLLLAAMRGDGRREEAVRDARQAYSAGLARSLQHAQALTAMESEGMKRLGVAGNLIAHKVLAPSQQLAASASC